MNKKNLFVILLYVGIVLVTLSCSKRNYPSTSNDEKVFYPLPPDSARIQFLAGYGSSTDFFGKQNRFRTFVAGPEVSFPILKPYGLAVHENKLFIVDAAIRGLQIVDLEVKSFQYFIPEGRGMLMVPINCFLDINGDLYITDTGRKQVVIFDSSRKYKGEIGGDENFKPADAVVSGDNIMVTDPNNNRINCYDKNTLQLLFSFPDGAKVGDKNWLYNPLNLCLAGEYIFITDFGDSQIKKFTKEGKYISSVGSYGVGLAQFVRPKGIAVDRDLNLFVVDAGFENIQIFNKEYQLLMYFGGAYNGRPGGMMLPANVVIDYANLKYFEKYVDPSYRLKYLIFVTNQYGPYKLSVYGRIELK